MWQARAVASADDPRPLGQKEAWAAWRELPNQEPDLPVTGDYDPAWDAGEQWRDDQWLYESYGGQTENGSKCLRLTVFGSPGLASLRSHGSSTSCPGFARCFVGQGLDLRQGDMLGSEYGVPLEWIQTQFMEVEVSKIAQILMNDLFRKTKRRRDQCVRDFNLEFERMVLRLHEIKCELPPLVKAWLQRAALVQDRTFRRGGPGGEFWKPNTSPGGKTAHHTGRSPL